MKKISTFFEKDPNNLGRVINKVKEENKWVFQSGIPTQKFDGTSCAIIKGELYKRYDAKVNKRTGKKKPIPVGAIPCQDADEKSGHHPHWVKCNRDNNQDKYHFEAFDKLDVNKKFAPQNHLDGTYELCGEKIQGNPEGIRGHELIKHGSQVIYIEDYSFEGIRDLLEKRNIEGIVFKHMVDDRMCKIRKSDFGLKR